MFYDTCNYYMCQSIVNMYTPIPLMGARALNAPAWTFRAELGDDLLMPIETGAVTSGNGGAGSASPPIGREPLRSRDWIAATKGSLSPAVRRTNAKEYGQLDCV